MYHTTEYTKIDPATTSYIFYGRQSAKSAHSNGNRTHTRETTHQTPSGSITPVMTTAAVVWMLCKNKNIFQQSKGSSFGPSAVQRTTYLASVFAFFFCVMVQCGSVRFYRTASYDFAFNNTAPHHTAPFDIYSIKNREKSRGPFKLSSLLRCRYGAVRFLPNRTAPLMLNSKTKIRTAPYNFPNPKLRNPPHHIVRFRKNNI